MTGLRHCASTAGPLHHRSTGKFLCFPFVGPARVAQLPLERDQRVQIVA